jgi:hypothetical protein
MPAIVAATSHVLALRFGGSGHRINEDLMAALSWPSMDNPCNRFPQLASCSRSSAADWSRRDGRVAEGARLESVFTRKGNVGSNPTLSASSKALTGDEISRKSVYGHPRYFRGGLPHL